MAATRLNEKFIAVSATLITRPLSRARRSMQCCAADPGSYRILTSKRSRICGASFRFAARCTASGTRNDSSSHGLALPAPTGDVEKHILERLTAIAREEPLRRVVIHDDAL